MGVHKFDVDSEKDWFYEVRKRKKRGGGVRVIHAPSPKLKKVQKDFSQWFYKKNKKQFEKNPQITGFLPGKSIADNARPHLNKEWVMTMDIADFFPTTSRHMIRSALFELWSNSPWWKKIFGFYKGMGTREVSEFLTLDEKLVQGSPASPVIANYIAIKEIDEIVKKRLDRLMLLKDINYTRYADDITISCNRGEREDVLYLVDRVTADINRGVYKIKEKKTDIKHCSQRQMVTGVLVNGENPRIERRLMDNMRAAIHNCNKNGEELSDEIKGMMSFIQSINKNQYEKLTTKIGVYDESN